MMICCSSNNNIKQLLILDEADRCLDLGFSSTLNSILENLPQQRQTLLFSATHEGMYNNNKLKDLARLSLRSESTKIVNIYNSNHSNNEYSIKDNKNNRNENNDDRIQNSAPTPNRLLQKYMIVQSSSKLNMLWSFLKTHLNKKVLIFFSTCKQVQFFHELFKKLRPGVPVRMLHGNLRQSKRMLTFHEFSDNKVSKMVLFATDVASR